MTPKTKKKVTTRKTPAKSKSKLVEQDKLEKLYNPNIQTVWADSVQIYVRQDIQTATLAFDTIVLPDRIMEACRVQTSLVHVKKMIDVLCKITEYYPEKLNK